MKNAVRLFKGVMNGEPPKMAELKARRKDGSIVFVEVNPKVMEKDGEISGILTIIRDITERKKIEAELHSYRDHLEELVKERTHKLEEANIALKVMLKKAQEVRTEIENNISLNVKEVVLPYLEKLRKSKLSETQKTYLDSIEDSLNDISASHMHGISAKYLKLTPSEIQVANLIKQGKSTKEIADFLDMSTRTIDGHRYNIRIKFGLTNKKENLRTYLLSLT